MNDDEIDSAADDSMLSLRPRRSRFLVSTPLCAILSAKCMTRVEYLSLRMVPPPPSIGAEIAPCCMSRACLQRISDESSYLMRLPSQFN
ncbi:hypothetical protein WOLCODRAFT_133540 [Wolfiporia cocos MD-104 SS10]|uniref:Uncharacterized protein n=1 Tax=Wolfiporia cocos (strain MD-104) TaxID=742152 RepID=A0A2H3IXC3_WOLCO|nr:hypothetical protein WOLCODRAFT_133540 [Wolfiporia cocos MD-104 SS10]